MRKNIFTICLIILSLSVIACNSKERLDITDMEKTPYNLSEESEAIGLSIKEKAIAYDVEKIKIIGTVLFVWCNYSLGDKQTKTTLRFVSKT